MIEARERMPSSGNRLHTIYPSALAGYEFPARQASFAAAELVPPFPVAAWKIFLEKALTM